MGIYKYWWGYNKYWRGYVNTGGDIINTGGGIINNGGDIINTGGGIINTGGGIINTGGGIINTGGDMVGIDISGDSILLLRRSRYTTPTINESAIRILQNALNNVETQTAIVCSYYIPTSIYGGSEID